MPQLNDSLPIASKSQIRARNNYQGTQMQFMCIVCLTRSTENMYHLFDKLDLDNEEYVDLTIKGGLQKATASKIFLHNEYPQCICPICFSILKISLKFIYQFEKNQTEIRKTIGINSSVVTNNDFENHSMAPVELIYGDNKYGLNELLVVEPCETNDFNFNGFLKNLGKEVSATFTELSKPEDSSVSIDTGQEVSISLIGNNKLLPVKELELDEGTNMIKCVVEDEDGGEILKLIVESNDDSDDDNDVEFNEVDGRSVDLQLIRDENGSKQKNESSCRKSLNVAQMPKDNVKWSDDDLFQKEIRFPCDICKKVFDFEDRLKAHKRRTHGKKQKVYNCNICGYKNNTLSAHKHHKTKHVGKKWPCSICKKSYYTKAVLKVHMQTHNNRREHLCTVCGKGFNYANALVYHMRLHTGEKNYVCKYCNQKFRMQNSLNRHIRCHTGERPFKCKYCEKAFRSKGEVKCHEYGHTGCRPYHCRYCQKGFSKTHNLKLHLLSHGGPHKCELCGRSFIEPAILSMHYRISHNDVEGKYLQQIDVKFDNFK